MIARIRILSLLPAIVLFFFPWVEVQCRKVPMFTQTGVEIIYGGATQHPEFTNWTESEKPKTAQDRLGTGWLVGIALITVTGAAIFAFQALRSPDGGHGPRADVFATLALIALLVQLSTGFPAEKKIKDDADPAKSGKPADTFEAGVSRTIANSITTRVLPLYYVQLGLLGLPVLLLLNSSLMRLQKKDDGPKDRSWP